LLLDASLQISLQFGIETEKSGVCAEVPWYRGKAAARGASRRRLWHSGGLEDGPPIPHPQGEV